MTENPCCQVYLWEGGLAEPESGGPAAVMDPDRLKNQHPLWQNDHDQFGPWEPAGLLTDDLLKRKDAGGYSESGPGPSVRLPGRIWHARQSRGEARTVICGPCASAMDVAWLFRRMGLMRPWDSVLAVSQQAGRGRHLRNWLSPAGNLYAAWCWPRQEMRAGAGWAGLFPLLAGWLLADYLERKSLTVRIKWPNDLLVNGRKIGGILLEQQHGDVLVGIGLNLVSHPEDASLRDDFAVGATSFKQEGLPATPLGLWTDLASAARRRFEQVVEAFSPEEWVPLLNRRLAWAGRPVLIQTGRSEVYEATLLGLAPDGGLRVKCGQKTQVIYSGSLIPAEHE